MSIYPAYILKDNSNHKKQVILFMIPNGERWHCIAVETLSELLNRITVTHDGDFYCFNCLQLFRTKKVTSHKKVCDNKHFCDVVMPSEDANVLEFNQYQKSDKKTFNL